jgi:FlaG/FlaF family flagellin (archaellin)
MDRPVREQTASPVFGVLLIVGVVMAVSAAGAVFVFGVGDVGSTGEPTATFAFDQQTVTVDDESGPELTVVGVTYENGDSLDGGDLRVLVEGERAYGLEPLPSDRGSESEPTVVGPHFESRTVRAGDEARVAFATSATVETGASLPVGSANASVAIPAEARLDPNETVRVVYEGDSGNSYILDSYNVTAE